MPDPKRQRDKYVDEMGSTALERQLRDRRERHACCGELVEQGHHFMCSERPPDEPAALIEGQESLL